MTLTRFLLSSVAFATIAVAGSASVHAADNPQVLGTSSTDTSSTSQMPTPPDLPPLPPLGSSATTAQTITPMPDTSAAAASTDLLPVQAPSSDMTLSVGGVSMTPTPTPKASATVVPLVSTGYRPGLAKDTTQPVVGDSAKAIPPGKKPDGPEVYYDSKSKTTAVPTGPLANHVGPRKVDPTQEPGSNYVVGQQTAAASETEALLVAASRALDLDRNDAALDMFNQLYLKNQRDPRILMGRAVAQQKTGQDDLAIVTYQSLLDIDPTNSDAVVNMMGLIQKQYPAVALRRLTDLQAKYPGNAGIAAQLGMTHAQMGNNQEAIRALSAAASMEPHNAQIAFNMAIVFDRAGDKINAMKYYQQALETDAVYGNSRTVPRDKIYDRMA